MKPESYEITVNPVLALKDNYIWIIQKNDSQKVWVVDPGEETPVIAFLTQHKLSLAGILITHHHGDHCNGAKPLQEKYNIPVYWPGERAENETIVDPEISLNFKVLKIPGHTLDHVAYYGHGVVFCGDTLFTGGCGRLFEGSAQQLWESLEKLKSLPDETRIYCGHEYTLSKLKFAALVEPENQAIQERIAYAQTLRNKLLPTVPSTLKLEKETNPFLRANITSVKKAAENYWQTRFSSDDLVFAALRKWKDLLAS